MRPPARRSSRASPRDVAPRALDCATKARSIRARSSRRSARRAAPRASRSPRRPRRARRRSTATASPPSRPQTSRDRGQHVLLAAGARSGSADWLPEAVRLPVEPVKGQLLRARLPAPPARILVRSASAYVVPRPDGRVVVGATSERSGFDESRTPEARGAAPRRGEPLPARDRRRRGGGALRRLPSRHARRAPAHRRDGARRAPRRDRPLPQRDPPRARHRRRRSRRSSQASAPPPELAAADPRRFA